MTIEAMPLLTETQVLEYVREHGLEIKPRKPPVETVPRTRLNEVIAERNQLRIRCAELEDLVQILQAALQLARQRKAIEEAGE